MADLSADEKSEWAMCEEWMEHRSDINCAHSILNTDDSLLPNHICDIVYRTSQECHAWRHDLSSPTFVMEGWRTVVGNLPNDGNVFLVVERVLSGGGATLFGIHSPVPGEPKDYRGYFPAIIEECVIHSYGTGADLEYKLRKWYDELYRGHNRKGGRPHGTRWGGAELRAAFECALADMRREHMRTTEEAIARRVGVSVRTLQRAMDAGTIPRRREWDSLKR
jgi:hypothetical protein